jgi:predicted MPP superfamily phosphohydrolase
LHALCDRPRIGATNCGFGSFQITISGLSAQTGRPRAVLATAVDLKIALSSTHPMSDRCFFISMTIKKPATHPGSSFGQSCANPITIFPRLSPLLLVGLTALGGLHYYMWEQLAKGVRSEHLVFASLFGGYLVVSMIAIPMGLLLRRVQSQRVNDALTWGGMLAMGVFSTLLVMTVLRQLLLALAHSFAAAPLDLEFDSALAVPIIAIFASAVGFVLARLTPRIVEVDIPITGLPAELEGFRIVQITDIHVGPTIRRGFLQRVVERVNTLQADVIAITGDVVDGRVEDLREHTSVLRDLRAKEFTALVLGNHELYSGAWPWVTEFRRLGLRVLLNEHLLIERSGHRIAIAGVTDHSAGSFHLELACNPEAAISNLKEEVAVKVLLAHQPITAVRAAGLGYHLSLHGHTHGGQWWPWNHFVKLQQPVTRGLRKFGEMWSYTSVGTGYWGPPKRHFRSEITLLRLVGADQSVQIEEANSRSSRRDTPVTNELKGSHDV